MQVQATTPTSQGHDWFEHCFCPGYVSIARYIAHDHQCPTCELGLPVCTAKTLRCETLNQIRLNEYLLKNPITSFTVIDSSLEQKIKMKVPLSECHAKAPQHL